MRRFAPRNAWELAMALEEYRRKRDFTKTAEPAGRGKPGVSRRAGSRAGSGASPAKSKSKAKQLHFVVQEHHARRLHFDLRLEAGGVLKSWAVPKGPSLDPADKRLAVMTEDHPLQYLDFEGHIPEGSYGAGDMVVWDTGTYQPAEGYEVEEGLDAGKLHFVLQGSKLRGEFYLLRMRPRGERNDENQWLLIKVQDDDAVSGWILEPEIDESGARTSGSRARRSSGKTGQGGIGEKSENAGEDKIGAASQKASMPEAAVPMLATLVDHLPVGKEWLYEIKWDGYRTLAFIEKGECRLISRNSNDLTPLFPAIAEALAELPVSEALLDGEVVALDEHGAPSFQLLQNATKIRAGLKNRERLPRPSTQTPLVFYGFDMLYCEGVDLTAAPLMQRRQALELLLQAGDESVVRFSAGFTGAKAGQDLMDQARREGLEGVMAKNLDSKYVQRRSPHWLKLKLQQTMDVVIGGFTEPRGSREHFGALLLGAYQDGELVYVGHAGTGFTGATLKDVHKELAALETQRCPFREKPVANEKPHWVKPQLVCEVKYGEVTADGRLRHPVFLRLRPDKDPGECRLEVQAPVATEEALNQDGGDAEAKRSASPKKARTSEAPAPKASAPKAPARKAPGAKASAKDSGETPKSSAHAAAAKTKDKPTRKGTAVTNGGSTSPLNLSEVPQELQHGARGDVELQLEGQRVKLTNLHKVYWPKEQITKGDLLRYYFRMAPVLLPYLKDRPLILQRFPNGIEGKHFFQHNLEDAPGFVPTYRHVEAGETIHYALCDSLPALLYLVNLGTITQNPWSSRCNNAGYPDWFVFDLDPPDEVPFSRVCRLAVAIHDLLLQLGLESYAKTSGSRGMHVFLPVEAHYTYDQLMDFGTIIAELVVAHNPDLATTERTINKRPRGRIYLDIVQNREGKSVAAPYAVRPRPGATVSAPVTWAQVKRGVKIADFDIESVPKRVHRGKEPFAGVLLNPQRIEGAMERLSKLLKTGGAKE